MINRNKLANVINALAKLGLMYSVTFTKKNGEKRKMTCRGKVGKYVMGTGRPGGNSRPDNSFVTVYEMNGIGGRYWYRTINLDTIETIKTCGITATVTPAPMPVLDCSSYNTNNIVNINS